MDNKTTSRTNAAHVALPAHALPAWLETPGTIGAGLGSHMPLDTGIQWQWRNPLNIVPAIIVLFLLVALVTMVLAQWL